MSESVLQRSYAPTLAIVGGGLAGMAAAWDAAGRGWRVELFERSKTLGGRAGSFRDPKIEAAVDYCQHVAMGCCQRFIEFCAETEIDDCFRRARTLHFIGPDGRLCDLTPVRCLPPPLHLLPGLAKLKFLSSGERWQIVRALRKLSVGWVERSETHQLNGQNMAGLATLDPPYNDEPVGDWLRRHGQSQRAIDRFWSPVLAGALAETVDHASLDAARKVFRYGFLASRDASDLLLPRRPLSDIFNARLGRRLAERGVWVRLNTPVRRIEGNPQSANILVLADGQRREFDRFIVAVPWRRVCSLLSEDLIEAIPGLDDAGKIPSAAIASVHFWFDRSVVPLRHAVLIGRLSQWVFADKHSTPQHCQVVISASHRLEMPGRDELANAVLNELKEIWPGVSEANVVHRRVVVQPAAVFSCLPGTDRLRPTQMTPIGNLAIAGDWTDTGWPGTMEGAVRSGQRAVGALAASPNISRAR
ncbi:MAG: FAD-dependent oxidoreductase [Pirellulales bacterium]|nr:FAD-dependent oxidoreductase [Pirellulales bacterium]